MADDVGTLGGGTGVGRTYRMSAPQRQAFDPTQLELLSQTQIAQPDGGQLLGYNLLARTRAENNQDAYMGALREGNQAQMQAAQLQERGELARAVLSARNPNLAYDLSPVRSILAPDRMDVARERSDIYTAGAAADVNNTNAQANQRNADAGVLPPAGSSYNQYSFPNATRTQGLPPAMMRGSGSGGTSARDELALERILQSIEQNVPAATQQFLRAQITAQGLQPTLAMDGTVVRPAGMSQEQFEQAVSRARAQAEADRDRRRTEVAQRLGQRFPGANVGVGTPPSGMAGTLPAAPPAVTPQTPPNIAPTNTAPAAVRPQSSPPAAGDPSANLITAERRTAIIRNAPPGAHSWDYNRVTGVTTYKDRAGNVIGSR